MTKDEAFIVALETLKQIQEGCNNVIADKLHSDAVDLAKLVRKDCNKPIDAIRKSLAQPEQKPVANGIIRTLISIDKDGIETWKHEPFYTAPPKREWVGLTGPEVVEAYRSVSEKEWAIGGLDDARVFFRAIEDKLREKNTYTTPPQRKPLTDEQLIAAYESEQQGRYGDHIRSLRAIEAAHGIKGE